MRNKEVIYKEAELYINSNLSIRELAEQLHVSKSTLHDDLNKKLNKFDAELFEKVKVVAGKKKVQGQFS